MCGLHVRLDLFPVAGLTDAGLIELKQRNEMHDFQTTRACSVGTRSVEIPPVCVLRLYKFLNHIQ